MKTNPYHQNVTRKREPRAPQSQTENPAAKGAQKTPGQGLAAEKAEAC